jgi:hypothetical protein
MDSDLNQVNITINASTDFVLLPASVEVVNDLPYSHILRFTTSRNIIDCLQLKSYFNVIYKLVMK